MTERNHPRATAAVTTLAMACLTTLTVVACWESPWRWLDLTVGVVSVALVPVLTWRPVTGAVALTVLTALSPVATPPATLGALQVSRRHGFGRALIVAGGGIAAHATQGAWRINGSISYGWWLLLITLGYGALIGWGAWARAREELIRSLRDRAGRAEAEQGRRIAEARMHERRQIAREMHDVLAHRLSLLATFAGALEYRPDAPPERLAHAAGVVRDGVHEALEELREVITLLRDDDEGFQTCPQPGLSDLGRLVDESRDAGTTVQLSDEVEDPATLPATAARTAYRVVQEALTNARKHAHGQPVSLSLRGRPGERLQIDLRNPVTLGAGPIVPGAGTGLVGLTERVHLAGGQLDHLRADGEFRVHAWIPWPV